MKHDKKIVIRICELLQEGKDINQIMTIMKFGTDKRYRDLIYKIRLRITWKTISKNYNW